MKMDYGRQSWRLRTARQWKRVSKHVSLNLNLYERDGVIAYFVDIRDQTGTSYHHFVGSAARMDTAAAYRAAVTLAERGDNEPNEARPSTQRREPELDHDTVTTPLQHEILTFIARNAPVLIETGYRHTTYFTKVTGGRPAYLFTNAGTLRLLVERGLIERSASKHHRTWRLTSAGVNLYVQADNHVGKASRKADQRRRKEAADPALP